MSGDVPLSDWIFTMNLRDKKLATGVTLSSWCVLAFLSPDVLPDHDVAAFVRELVKRVSDHTGMVS